MSVCLIMTKYGILCLQESYNPTCKAKWIFLCSDCFAWLHKNVIVLFYIAKIRSNNSIFMWMLIEAMTKHWFLSSSFTPKVYAHPLVEVNLSFSRVHIKEFCTIKETAAFYWLIDFLPLLSATGSNSVWSVEITNSQQCSAVQPTDAAHRSMLEISHSVVTPAQGSSSSDA